MRDASCSLDDSRCCFCIFWLDVFWLDECACGRIAIPIPGSNFAYVINQTGLRRKLCRVGSVGSLIVITVMCYWALLQAMQNQFFFRAVQAT